MARQKVQTRCDGDTVEAIENYCDDHDVSQSEAVRRLIRAGLIERGYEIDVATKRGTLEQEITLKAAIATVVVVGTLAYLFFQFGL